RRIGRRSASAICLWGAPGRRATIYSGGHIVTPTKGRRLRCLAKTTMVVRSSSRVTTKATQGARDADQEGRSVRVQVVRRPNGGAHRPRRDGRGGSERLREVEHRRRHPV